MTENLFTRPEWQRKGLKAGAFQVGSKEAMSARAGDGSLRGASLDEIKERFGAGSDVAQVADAAIGIAEVLGKTGILSGQVSGEGLLKGIIAHFMVGGELIDEEVKAEAMAMLISEKAYDLQALEETYGATGTLLAETNDTLEGKKSSFKRLDLTGEFLAAMRAIGPQGALVTIYQNAADAGSQTWDDTDDVNALGAITGEIQFSKVIPESGELVIPCGFRHGVWGVLVSKGSSADSSTTLIDYDVYPTEKVARLREYNRFGTAMPKAFGVKANPAARGISRLKGTVAANVAPR